MNVETPPFKTAGPMSRRVEIERESRSPVKLNKKTINNSDFCLYDCLSFYIIFIGRIDIAIPLTLRNVDAMCAE